MNPLITAEEALNQLKKVWNTDELKFIAKYQKNQDKKGGFFTELKVNDREVFYPRNTKENHQYSRKVNIYVKNWIELVNDKYYLIELKLEEDEFRQRNPFELKLESVYEIENYITPKEFIGKRFVEKGQSPSDAITIASQLSLNELELYTHTKRFVFELIQNADDMPREGKSVNIEIYLTKNFLLFLHDGKFFDREDVTAICDAARSNKKLNTTQTGYKGIGFKSVFTDSSRVYISSGDYSFKFDKEADVYKDFWKLYEGLIKKFNPQALKEFKDQYTGKEGEFLKIENIPWQIKPIWVEKKEIPTELRLSPFIDPKYQVAIALEVGENKINDKEKDYHRMINQLINEPRFLLFLRNVTGLDYQRLTDENPNRIKINITKKPYSIEVKKNDEILANYLKKDFIVTLTNEDFKKAGLDFTKVEKKDKTVFIDSEGKQLDNIPEKLVKLNKTAISYAAKIEESKIQSLPSENSILFNYLPTSDNRFGFHFLVNADFVSKTDREFIQIENKWNHYLFYKIGYNLIKWLNNIINSGNDNPREKNKFNSAYAASYLSLLPAKPLDEENQERGAINKAFNTGLKEGIEEIPFILTSDGSIKKSNEIILDNTGFIKALKGKGIGFLKFATKTTKEFINFRIEEKHLKHEYLNVEKIETPNLVSAFDSSENKELFRNTIKNLDVNQYKEFLDWINNFFTDSDIVEKIGKELPFIRINEEIYSFKECQENTSIILKTKKTQNIEDILRKNKFLLSEFYIDEYPHLLGIAKQEDSYITNDIQLYEVISSSNYLGKLSPVEKNQLLDFLIKLEKVGPVKVYNEIRLFKGKKLKELFPLSSLVSTKDDTIPKWFDSLIIIESEQNELDIKHQKALQTKETLLKNILCKPDLFNRVSSQIIIDENFDEFYNHLETLFKYLKDEEKDGFPDIPWIYSPKKEKFLLPSEIYCPESFHKIESIIKYYETKEQIEKLTDLNLPIFSSISIIKTFTLGCISGSIQKHITKEAILDKRSVKPLLEWLSLNSEESFLTQNNFLKDGINYKLIKTPIAKPYFFTRNEDLISYINDNSLLKDYSLYPLEIYAKQCDNLGLLQSDALIEKLIEKGANQASFSKHILEIKNDLLKEKYLESLENIEIDSTKINGKETSLNRIFRIIEELDKKLEEKSDLLLEKIRGKILIDKTTLSNKAVSDDIFFPERKEVKGFNLGIPLSDIIKKYRVSSFSVNSLIDSFPGISAGLIRKTFKTSRRKPELIFSELSNLSTIQFFDPYQTYFLLRYSVHYEIPNVFTTKPSFSYFKDVLNQQEKYLSGAKIFLEICFKDNFAHSRVFEILGLKIENHIINPEFSVDSEKLPDWIITWISDNLKKIEYLQQCGLNQDNSPVILLRSGLLRNNPDLIGKGRENLHNNFLLKNTLSWLLKKQITSPIKLKKEYLLPLYQKLNRENISIFTIPIPVLKGISLDEYNLVTIDDKKEIHKINSSWGLHSEEIFNNLKSRGILTIDEVVGNNYLIELKPKDIAVYDGYDTNKLSNHSTPLNNEWYQKWSNKLRFPIFIYEGKRLPKIISYSNYLQKHSVGEFATKEGNNIYIAKTKELSIIDEIEEFLPPSLFQELVVLKRNHDKELKERESKISYSPEEEEALKRVFGNNAPKGFQKDLNLAALIKGLSYLHFHGYDVSYAENNLKDSHQYSQLEPVYKNGIAFKVKCRSAKSGLLYLRASSWMELEDPNTFLYVWTGFNYSDAKLCKTREEVIEDLRADYQVVRLESKPSVDTLDKFLNGNLDPDDIWLIVRMKNKEEYRGIFEDIRKKSETDRIDNLSLGNEDED